MLANPFPHTDIHFSFSYKKQGQRHKALLFSFFEAVLIFANKQGQFPQALSHLNYVGRSPWTELFVTELLKF